MKVLHIIDSLGLGGAQTVVKGIFEKQKDNKNIFLFVLRKREINIEINHPNVFIYDSEAKYSFKPLKDLREIIEKEKIDILHCHLFRSQVFGLILKKKYFPKIKLIFHEHGEIFQRKILYNYLMKKSRYHVDRYIAVSKATKNKLIEIAKIPENKIEVLYNFVDLDRFNRKNIKINVKKEKEKLGIKKDEFVIGFAGRLAKVKGCKYLIKALHLLDFKCKCLIVGEGPERKNLENLAKELKVEDKVIFLGYIDKPEKIYVLLNILIIPSVSESFGISVIEAQSIGIPVIASNIDGLNEIITDRKDGLLFRKGDEKELTLKVKELSEDRRLRYKIIKNSYKDKVKYSLNDYLKKMDLLYNEI